MNAFIPLLQASLAGREQASSEPQALLQYCEAARLWCLTHTLVCARAGKYSLQQGNFRGEHAIEVTARTARRGPERRVTCKFFATPADYNHEAQLHELLPSHAAILGE